MNRIKIRSMKKTDIQIISQGWESGREIMKRYFLQQNSGARDVFIVEYDGEIAARVTIKWVSKYIFFKDNNIPEIKDLQTFSKFRKRGIATLLMDKAEARVKEKGYKTIGLGVGLYSDYGTAQKMYIKRGYNFDGMGINYDNKIVKPGSNVCVDDSLCICMTKEI